MARFFGRYEHSLDVKGRVILPARFRSSFDTVAYVTQHHDRCLALWTPAEFEVQLGAMEAKQGRSAADRNLARVWASGAVEVELDRTGRVALPAYLRQYAHLDGQVLVMGAIDRIELWNPTEWAARVAPAESALSDPQPEEPEAG
ncbi:MAG TPA: division/cell wall cluster transcriptional repressor MraZ [Acidimicrobiales bacterium]|nr:division/cell wall cluster transcriptional repressor MraZ [Acidimicrobiales bacterium]